MRVTNKDIPDLVRYCRVFNTPTRTAFANYTDSGLYVVYSYGYHWPLAAYDSDESKWIINTEKYSKTTNRHLSLVRQGIASLCYSPAIEETDKLGVSRYIMDYENRKRGG